MERLDTLQQFFDQSLRRALQDNANQFRSLQTQIQTIIGNLNQLQSNIFEVDEHCRRTGERLDAWDLQDVSEYAQELEPVDELDGENDYEDDRTVTTHVPVGLAHGLQSASSLGGVTSADGASEFTAPRDIPFSERIPTFPVPKSKASPPDLSAPQTEEYPSDPAAQVEWHENRFKKLYKQSIGIDDDIVSYRKQLIPDAFTVQPLPTAAGFESWLNTLITQVHAAAQGLDSAREWIAGVKRDPDIDKYESAEKFEVLDRKVASALKPVLSKRLNILVTQKERTLELTNGKPFSGRQILW